jgi:hypothetical protein
MARLSQPAASLWSKGQMESSMFAMRPRVGVCWLWFALAGCDGKIISSVGGQMGSNPDGPGAGPPTAECVLDADPGLVVIRRLNRVEYDNTVRDLLGDSSHPARDFPPDTFGEDFDNNGALLSTSPAHVEKYALAAEKLALDVLQRDGAVTTSSGGGQRVLGNAATSNSGVLYGTTSWNLWGNANDGSLARLSAPFNLPAGDSVFAVHAFGEQAGSDPVRMRMLLDGAELSLVDVTAVAASPQLYTAKVSVSTAGMHTLGVEFVNDYYDPASHADRNLIIDWLEVDPPSGATPASHVLTCDPSSASCVRDIATRFGRRAWRRPLSAEEIDGLVAVADAAKAQGETPSGAIGWMIQAVLLSPSFMFRVELDDAPGIHPLSDHELAARLSYALWASMPDPELSDLADRGQLRGTLDAEVTRMLADGKAAGFVHQFAGNWLRTNQLDGFTPSSTLFPAWNDGLRTSMQQQSEAVFADALSSGRSAQDLLGADFTYVNDALATLEGITPPGTTALSRVAVPHGDLRGSLLGLPGVLSSSSVSSRTSLVRRGKLVLSQFLCSAPPPPPADLAAAINAQAAATGESQRAQSASRLSNARCAACHGIMDPIGYGLENFDAIGEWRTLDTDGSQIDPSGRLDATHTFSTPRELLTLLQADARYPGCFTEKLLAYALGRSGFPVDRCAAAHLTHDVGARGFHVSDLVHAIVTHPLFGMRRMEAP